MIIRIVKDLMSYEGFGGLCEGHIYFVSALEICLNGGPMIPLNEGVPCVPFGAIPDDAI